MGCVVKAWWCGPAVDSESDGGGGGRDGCEGCGEGCEVGEGSEGVGTGCEDGPGCVWDARGTEDITIAAA